MLEERESFQTNFIGYYYGFLIERHDMFDVYRHNILRIFFLTQGVLVISLVFIGYWFNHKFFLC